MKNQILEKLLKAIENRFGDTSDDLGCYINGKWLSLSQIASIIESVDEEN